VGILLLDEAPSDSDEEKLVLVRVAELVQAYEAF
jgi:hypothetical protein